MNRQQKLLDQKASECKALVGFKALGSCWVEPLMACLTPPGYRGGSWSDLKNAYGPWQFPEGAWNFIINQHKKGTCGCR